MHTAAQKPIQTPTHVPRHKIIMQKKTITTQRKNTAHSTQVLSQLASKRITVCCLARDCAKFLSANIARMKKLATNFAEVQYIVVENDSKDNTRQVLEHWKQHSKYQVLLPDIYSYKEHHIDIPVDFSRDSDAQSVDGIYARRVTRISLARDCYLDALYISNFTPDFVLMCDIDVFNFSITGILESLCTELVFDGVTANGQIYEYDYTKHRIRKKYYDSYAVEEWETTSLAFDIKIDLQEHITEQLANGKWLQVHSAFGGMGIYTYKAIYSPSPTTYLDAIAADEYKYCEHVSFHRALRKKGFGNIYINPQMELYYNTKLRAFAKACLAKLKLR